MFKRCPNTSLISWQFRLRWLEYFLWIIISRLISHKMKNSFYIIAFLLCILSCSKKDNCKEELLTIKHFETENGCINTRFSLQIDLNNECTIIRSKDTYDSKVTGICHPSIDFTIYDLVIGKQSTALPWQMASLPSTGTGKKQVTATQTAPN